MLVVNDAVNVMVAYQPVCNCPSSTVYHTLAHRLVHHHDIDRVINDKHNRIIIVVLAKHEIAP